jgi:hypothetical protein
MATIFGVTIVKRLVNRGESEVEVIEIPHQEIFYDDEPHTVADLWHWAQELKKKAFMFKFESDPLNIAQLKDFQLLSDAPTKNVVNERFTVKSVLINHSSDFSTRLINALNQMPDDQVVIDIPKHHFLKCRNTGKRTWQELQDHIALKHLY